MEEAVVDRSGSVGAGIFGLARVLSRRCRRSDAWRIGVVLAATLFSSQGWSSTGDSMWVATSAWQASQHTGDAVSVSVS